jgi:hypothetical protein
MMMLRSEQPGTRFKDASFCVKQQGAQVALPSVGSKRAKLSMDLVQTPKSRERLGGGLLLFDGIRGSRTVTRAITKPRENGQRGDNSDEAYRFAAAQRVDDAG